MNIRLLNFLTLSFLLLNAPLVVASEAGPARAIATDLGKCPICQEEMTQGELASDALVSGEELFGCSPQHLMHRTCILNEHGQLLYQNCPMCRATHNPSTVVEQRHQLMTSYTANFPMTPAIPLASTHSMTPLELAQHALTRASVPAGVRPEIWYSIQQQLSITSRLYLGDCNLAAAELAAIIAALPQILREFVTGLYVHNNQLASLPDNIDNLTALQQLHAPHNKLTQLPDIIGNLTVLEHLDVSANRLTHLPDTIGNLTTLRVLWVESNQLDHVTEAIGNLIALQELYVSDNQLTELPDSLGRLNTLRILSVDRTVRLPALRPEIVIFR